MTPVQFIFLKEEQTKEKEKDDDLVEPVWILRELNNHTSYFFPVNPDIHRMPRIPRL